MQLAGLLKRGVPAAVAMQFTVGVASALSFGTAFYRELARGKSLEVAVTEGRLAILRGECGSEWVTPVAFLQARDGKLLKRPPTTPSRGDAPRTGGAAPTPGAARDPLKLGIFTSREWAGMLAVDNDALIDLSHHFEGREIRHPSRWGEGVFTELRQALRVAAAMRRPLHLDFAANATIAFAAGWCLSRKSGLDSEFRIYDTDDQDHEGRGNVEIRQRLFGSPSYFDYRGAEGDLPADPLWLDEPDLPGHSESADVALAVSVSNDVAKDVQLYLADQSLAVSRVVRMSVPETGNQSVLSGAHALALARKLARKIDDRTLAELRGVLHLFISAPNALLFFVGQLAGSFGTVQLYEHRFKSGKRGDYVPSLRLPVTGVEP